MKKYNRIMAGARSANAQLCFSEGFIGVDYGLPDLTGKLPEDWREFNREFIPVYLEGHPDKTKIAAGLACGLLGQSPRG